MKKILKVLAITGLVAGLTACTIAAKKRAGCSNGNCSTTRITDVESALVVPVKAVYKSTAATMRVNYEYAVSIRPAGSNSSTHSITETFQTVDGMIPYNGELITIEEWINTIRPTQPQ